ncbi:MAG: ornithine carbamoyltransferase [Nitrospiraceae bacterium]|nr:ornithine carbamoyltransferase [Nitrospiraceae bacterium]
MKKDVLAVADLSHDEITRVLSRAAELKSGRTSSSARPLSGRSVGLLFEKPSTRTRVSFEVGAFQLGAQPVCLSISDLQLGRGETVSDTARTLSRYLDAIVIRTSAHERLEVFAEAASIPVVNGLSDRHHPCQALADILTMQEKKGRLKGLRVAFIGDGNNVCNSLIEAASRMEFNLTVACPEGFEPDAGTLSAAQAGASAEIVVLRDPREAAGMADVVYTDVWVSMGQELEAEEKRKKFRDYQINSRLLSCAKNDVTVLHCLPAHRGEEITDEVIDGAHSAVFDQAENRLHVQKALMELILP